MGIILVPRTRVLQPRSRVGINRSNSLGQKVIAAFNGSDPYHLIGLDTSVSVTGVSNIRTGPNIIGSNINAGATTVTLTGGKSKVIQNPSCTLYVFGQIESNASAGGGAGCYLARFDNGSEFISLTQQTATTLTFRADLVGGGVRWLTSAFTVTVKTPFHAFVWNALGAPYTTDYMTGQLNNGPEVVAADNGVGTFPSNMDIFYRGNTNETADAGDYTTFLAVLFEGILTRTERASIVANPWQILEDSPTIIYFPTSVSNIARPSSDITTTGWTANGGPSECYDCMNEVTYSDTDFAKSPAITGAQGPLVVGITPTLAAGNQTVRIRGDYTLSSAQVKVTLLDSGDTPVGNTGWQSLTGAATTYELPVTTTGTATKAKIEVQ